MNQISDRGLLYLWLMLLGAGILASTSVSVHTTGYWFNPIMLKHLLYVGISGLAFVIGFYFPHDRILQFHRFWWVLALFLSCLVFIPGIGLEAGGSRRWINLHYATLQVSEWVKPLLIAFIAGYLATNQERIQKSLFSMLILLGAVGAVLFLVILEPDYGTVALLSIVTMGMLFMANARMSHIVVLGAIATAGVAMLLVLEPYRVARFMTYLSPWGAGEYAESYQITNSLIAIGRGELTGTGLGTGLQKTFTPASHNDFIYSTIAEEVGLLGSGIVVMLLMALVYKISLVGRLNLRNKDYFEGYFCYGVAMLVGLQVLVHVAVNVNAIPTKGLTLPFISYGGNSLVILAGLLGLVVRMSVTTKESNRR